MKKMNLNMQKVKFYNMITTSFLFSVLCFTSCEKEINDGTLEKESNIELSDTKSEFNDLQKQIDSLDLDIDLQNIEIVKESDLLKKKADKEKLITKQTNNDINNIDIDLPNQKLVELTFDHAKALNLVESDIFADDYSDGDVIKWKKENDAYNTFYDTYGPKGHRRDRLRSFAFKGSLGGASGQFVGVIGKSDSKGRYTNINFDDVSTLIRFRYRLKSNSFSRTTETIDPDYVGANIRVDNRTNTDDTASSIQHPANLYTKERTRITGTARSTTMEKSKSLFGSGSITLTAGAEVTGQVSGTVTVGGERVTTNSSTTETINTTESSDLIEVGYGNIIVPAKGYCKCQAVAEKKKYTYRGNYELQPTGNLTYRYMSNDGWFSNEYKNKTNPRSNTNNFFKEILANQVEDKYFFEVENAYKASYECYLKSNNGDLLFTRGNVPGLKDFTRDFDIFKTSSFSFGYRVDGNEGKWFDRGGYFDGVDIRVRHQYGKVDDDRDIIIAFYDKNNKNVSVNVSEFPGLDPKNFNLHLTRNLFKKVPYNFDFNSIKSVYIIHWGVGTIDVSVKSRKAN